MKVSLVPENFPPQKGGISTNMRATAEYLSRTAEVVVFAADTTSAEKLDRACPYPVRRVTTDRRHSVLATAHLVRRLNTVPHIAPDSMNRLDEIGAALRRCFWNASDDQMTYVTNMIQAFRPLHVAASFDCLVCGLVLPAGLFALATKFWYGVPFIVFIHGAEFLFHQNRRSDRVQLRAILESADKIIVNSRFTRDLLLDSTIPEEKVALIHPGTDADFFAPGEPRPEIAKRTAHKSQKTLLTVANIEERKGHDTVIKAIALLGNRIPNIRYLIVGQGSNQSRLQDLADTLGVSNSVVFAGRVDEADLPDYYNAADLFVMPSRQIDYDVEGFGLSYIEASACAKPVIGGNSGGVEDAVEHGKTGFLVDPLDPNELAERIYQLLNDPALAQKMGARGRERVEKEFTWELSLSKVRQVLDEIAAHP